ncbi:flavodoxin [uncultured Alistipes sp.]|jgi:flavodoxin|uniref:flavodoxin n=1 Tax=uncultured Alistipes sp. TaxID=538949 RepID=UPI0025D26CC2|nr:flavodoxin [uncultured Alistipes sp.]
MTGIFYGSTMGTTEAIAADIAKQLGVSDADLHNVSDASAGEVQKYDLLILGSSTWGAGDLQDDWYGFLDDLKTQDLSGKKVALFGCGDSGGYPDTFCDALGLIYDGLQGNGCAFIGAYVPEGYDATGSLVMRDGKFLGLAIDESAPGKTDERVARWCEQIKSE